LSSRAFFLAQCSVTPAAGVDSRYLPAVHKSGAQCERGLNSGWFVPSITNVWCSVSPAFWRSQCLLGQDHFQAINGNEHFLGHQALLGYVIAGGREQQVATPLRPPGLNVIRIKWWNRPGPEFTLFHEAS